MVKANERIRYAENLRKAVKALDACNTKYDLPCRFRIFAAATSDLADYIADIAEDCAAGGSGQLGGVRSAACCGDSHAILFGRSVINMVDEYRGTEPVKWRALKFRGIFKAIMSELLADIYQHGFDEPAGSYIELFGRLCDATAPSAGIITQGGAVDAFISAHPNKRFSIVMPFQNGYKEGGIMLRDYTCV
jgi:hypothetical protein